MYLLVSFNIWLTYGESSAEVQHDTNQTVHLCQHTMTLQQIIQLLKQQPCAIIEKQNHQIKKRDTNAGSVDIHALQTTVNDHRTMINYLINNSITAINATYVGDAIYNHHSKTPPILTSWRDLVDLLFLTLLLGFIIYLLIWRSGCAPCDKVIQTFFGSIVNRVQHQQQQQQTQAIPMEINTFHRTKSQLHTSMMPTVSNGITQFNNGYISD